MKGKRFSGMCNSVILLILAVLWLGNAATVAAQSVTFDVPVQPLAAALDQFARQASLQLAFSPDLARDKTSSPVSGTMDRQAALTRLLQGTGLDGRISGSTVTIEKLPPRSGAEQELPAVEVSGTAPPITGMLPAFTGGQVARGGEVGLLGNRDFMDTPFNQSSYTTTLIQNQQARSIADVVKNDPSVRFNGTTTQALDAFNIRGFYTRSSDVAYHGMFGIWPDSQVGVEVIERVEVLKGPGALLYGMSPNGAVGGTINVVPKRAAERAITQVTGLFQSDGQPGAHVDVSRRFGETQEFGARLNAIYRHGDTASEGNSQEAGDILLALDHRGDAHRLFLDLGAQRRRSNGVDADSYLAAGARVPEAPDADNSYFQDWTSIDGDTTYGVLRGEFDLTSNVSAFAAAGFSHNTGNMILAYASNLDSAGNFDETFWGQSFYSDNLSLEAGVRGRFVAGGVGHQVVASAAALYIETGNISFADAIDGTVNRPSNPSNIYNPVDVPRPGLGGFPSVPKVGETTLTGFALADTLSFGEDLVQLTLGARLQQVEVENLDPATGASVDRYDESAVTPAIGIVFRPWRQVSFYANYIEGLTQGPTAEGPGVVNAGQVFPPSKTKQLEAGVKLDHGRMAGTISVFQISQPLGRLDQSTMVFGIDGEQRNRGVELSVFGEVTRTTRLLGGVMLLDAELTKTDSGLNDGKRAPGAEVNVNLGGEWDTPFLAGLTLSALGVYTGSNYVDSANTQKIPAWKRFDLGARYAFKAGDKPVVLRANVENVFDEDYWKDEYLYRGTPRTFLFSASVDF